MGELIQRWFKISRFYVPKNNKIKLLVLDGQQRLQSLCITVRGSYKGEELYFNVLGGKKEKEDIKPVKNIPDEVKGKYLEVSWKKIAGMRDIPIHEYQE